jgi:hypothetical protein
MTDPFCNRFSPVSLRSSPVGRGGFWDLALPDGGGLGDFGAPDEQEGDGDGG